MAEVQWVRPQVCESASCVEASYSGDTGLVLVRDSKLGDGSPVLEFSREEWDAFLADIQAGVRYDFTGPLG